MASSTLAEYFAQSVCVSWPREVGAIPVIYPLLELLQIRQTINELRASKAEIDLGRVVELLILNRLMSPQPLYRVGDWAERTVIVPWLGLDAEQLYDQRFGRALDELHDFLGEAWTSLAAKAIQKEGLDISVLHWDTTTLYLEGEYDESDLAEYGHSSDGFSDKKQIKIGLDVSSRERVPLFYRLLSGSTADITTSVPNLAAIAAFLKRTECSAIDVRPLVIGDCKMITPAAVAAAHRYHLSYLGPWENNKAVDTVLRSVSEADLRSQPLAYRPVRQPRADQPFLPYCGVWRTFSVTYEGATFAEERGLVVWSAGKQRLDEQKRKTYLKRLLNRLKEIQKHLNRGRYIQPEYTAHQIALAQRANPAKNLVSVQLTGPVRQQKLTFSINRQALEEAQALDGRYLLGTNASYLSADEALSLFKAQDRVEKQHAHLKGPLRVRPLYLHSDERIEGLVFISLLALLVRALLELHCRRAGLRHSAEQVFQAFASLYAIDQTFVDGSQFIQLGKITDFQRQVLEKLNFASAERYLQP